MNEIEVSHPKHYNIGKVEVVNLCEIWLIDRYHQLNSAIEYIFRCNHKGTKIKDLEKASFWLKRHLKVRSDKYEPLNYTRMNKDYHPKVAAKDHQLEEQLVEIVCLIVLSGKIKEAVDHLDLYIEKCKHVMGDDESRLL